MRTLLLLPLALAACAPTAREVAAAGDQAAREQSRLDRALAGYVADGAPQTCLSGIDRRVSNGSRQIAGSVLFDVGRGRIVRNDMGGNCTFRGDPILVTQTPSSQLCRGDIVQLIDRASRFPVGSCAYGDFVTYRRADRQ